MSYQTTNVYTDCNAFHVTELVFESARQVLAPAPETLYPVTSGATVHSVQWCSLAVHISALMSTLSLRYCTDALHQ